jgi:predicted lipoprotein with Yx(FWY)xxD motif
MLTGRQLAAVLGVAAAAAVAVILVVALRSTRARVQPAPAAPVAAVHVAKTKLGRILVNHQGRTLYLFLEDKHGRSRCFGGCARVWPPAVVGGTAKPKAGPGVNQAKLTTRRRPHLGRQLVYNGHPLYTTVADARPGQTTGQGYFGTWFVISPSGRMIGKPGKKSSGY